MALTWFYFTSISFNFTFDSCLISSFFQSTFQPLRGFCFYFKATFRLNMYRIETSFQYASKFMWNLRSDCSCHFRFKVWNYYSNISCVDLMMSCYKWWVYYMKVGVEAITSALLRKWCNSSFLAPSWNSAFKVTLNCKDELSFPSFAFHELDLDEECFY